MGSNAEELEIDTAEENPFAPSDAPPVDFDDYSCVVERLKGLVAGFDSSDSSKLAKENVEEIRQLLALRLPASACGENDVISPIRASLWSIMLLGLRPEDLNSQHELVSTSLHGRTSEADHAQGLMHFPKEDRRVLAADIKRTRQVYSMFKRDDVMKTVSQVLERYCVGHSIRYKQGQNELIAPFIMLEDPPLPLPVLGLLFESFMGRFVSRWFVDDEIEALLVSYRVFRVLLFYVDPGLASKLDEAEFVPELYATAWLITLFSRNLSLELAMRLWDVYLAVNDPALVFFLLAALLVRNRTTVMQVDHAHMMPETVQGLGIDDKQDLEELIVQAREMMRKIPETFLRTVRSCCSDHGNNPLDTSRSLFCESVRCASIGPGELLERMTGRSGSDTGNGQPGLRGNDAGSGGPASEGNRSPCPMRWGPVDTVALDIRPLQEFENSGVGHLGKSVRLDPSLLEMGDVLEKWMQHFDGTRGTHVCLVDSLQPPTPATKNAVSDGKPSSSKGELVNGGEGGKRGSAAHIIEDPLWRRLLFGEDMGEAEWVKVNGPQHGQAGGGGDGVGGGQGAVASVGEEDKPFGAAKAFAEKLHARGFPYVSILEGGMEGVIEHLWSVGSPIEPTVINHDPVAFKLWRKAQARREQPLDARATTSRAGEAFSWRGKGHTGNGISGGGGAGGGTSVEAGRAPSGKQKLGVMDRLGLGRVGQGVSHGVSTVARTGVRAVRGGAGMIIPSSRSAEGDGLGVGGGGSGGGGGGQRGVVSGSGVAWDGRDGVGEAARGEDGKNLSAIFGAIRDAQAGVRRTGTWAARGAGEVMAGPGEGRQPANLLPRSASSLSEGDSRAGSRHEGGGSGEVGGPAVVVAELGGRRLSNGGGGDLDMLVSALQTAEANGHAAVAKALRARLGLVTATISVPSHHDADREVLECLADLA